jgi:hypothetical protein
MRSLWVVIDSKPDQTRVLAMTGPTETILKARLSGTVQHPRAVPALLEALAIWEGRPVRAVIVAGVRDGSSVKRLKLEFGDEFAGQPLYELQFSAGHRHRHRDLLEGMGAFDDLRQLAMFEVAS